MYYNGNQVIFIHFRHSFNEKCDIFACSFADRDSQTFPARRSPTSEARKEKISSIGGETS